MADDIIDETPRPKRNPDGKYAKNSSGNAKGRPPKRKKRHSVPNSNRRAAFAIAEREIKVNLGGKPEAMTIYEANLLRLGIDGANGSRNAARLFIGEINRAANANGEVLEFTQMLLDEVNRLAAQNEKLSRLFPRHGVVRLSDLEDEEPEQARRDADQTPSEDDLSSG